MRRVAALLAVAAALGAVGAAVAHAVIGRGSPTPALPELHGQASWAPGVHRAPAGVPRGRVALLALISPRCRRCAAELRYTVDQLPVRLRPVVLRRAIHGRSLLLLVDRDGNLRTGYAFPFAPAFVEGDVRTLWR